MAKKIRVVEVGPRDGLQNEPALKQLPLDELVEQRVRFISALALAGLEDVEAGAFVRADRVPAMAGTDKVLQKLQSEHPKLWKSKKFWTLVPNKKGLDLALQAEARHVSVFTAASDAFNLKNIQMTIAESLATLRPVVEEATRNGLQVRGYVSTVWGCPYSGKVDPHKAKEVTEALLAMGVSEVSLGDTIGVATPRQVDDVLDLLPEKAPLAAHFHDTRGTAIANCLHAIERGIKTVDSSAGGLGGCPYAKGASGNLATEDLLYMLHGMGFQTGVELEKVCEASEMLEREMELSLPSRYFRAWKGHRR
ncbi:MAG TPA: hydroxymethylglutaryl-CoA lyase [Bdellovibrionota bacterium]|jgi:isopropylmalate/homocitrate/citramalate synthase